MVGRALHATSDFLRSNFDKKGLSHKQCQAQQKWIFDYLHLL